MASGLSPTEANGVFSLALFQKLSEEGKSANVFFSPFSISSALAMAMLGARANTSAQMLQVLCFTKPKEAIMQDPEKEEEQDPQKKMQNPMQMQIKTRQQMRMQIQQCSRLPQYLKKVLKGDRPSHEEVHTHFKQLLIEFNKTNAEYALSLANRLYGEQTYTFVEEFLEETKNFYFAEVESVDFKKNAEAARLTINSWVDEKTQGKIKDILPKDKVSDTTRLVLINAIYFKGNWNQKFNEELTVDAPFKINKNDTKPVKMMTQKSKFPIVFIPEINCQILELPYKGKDLSMLVFLPNEIEDDMTGLEKLKTALTYSKLMEWTSSHMMIVEEVEVGLPRFKMEVTYDLESILGSMGMVDAFDSSRSDFSGMSAANDLVLSKVIHKSFVEVNEEGSEAAAATALVFVERASAISHTFIADHPFLFFIRYNPTNTILFAGQYSSPE
ncbi:leukocyte elastase inhibitor-like isoform X3 [Nerophis lumbriciformis]|nr:leukocyte elastase inhibitor A-like isoform X3 [Nerophis lumbriciformis]XP_061821656.1 leukocyte elastase inhibitor A-like isoform X3 [Nerophis lumbriciformis]XP_061821657.1 leukocyte elastase inhibitor A-like isoform X3 [Nerophis lumbriciformis]XP_061821658.1 leukocyte elastase inhibitor A-like isoform X3 [Nerophis lumbriciformis]